MLKRLRLGEQVDCFGTPLIESRQVISFTHNNRPAEVEFDVFGGKYFAATRHQPEEYSDLKIKFETANYTDGNEEEIPKSELDLAELEEKAADRYWEEYMSESVDSFGIPYGHITKR